MRKLNGTEPDNRIILDEVFDIPGAKEIFYNWKKEKVY